ncbi:hypothetical protein G8759_19805 [Spirosoma aureum]|uniref:Large polyvalent protein-associated domain-containing protein n=1 Tax=Spirosoma aureum TaxID=2692134 RepID=A0A6G9AQT1_9BACT|nr:LPD1 domain-containing protein [Spirosoma aureum]QIP14696.1 hypothetical protein G8759_19805 [Spirosoma aureum]
MLQLKKPIGTVRPKERRLGLVPVFASQKYVDTNTWVSVGSRVNAYWDENGFTPIYKGFSRTKRTVSADDINRAVIKFRLKGIEFGNWLTNEDAYNYLAALVIALNDLTRIVGYSNIGLNGTIGIAFGARGSQRAAGHFEPDTFMINLTRYKRYIEDLSGRRIDVPKQVKFMETGGVGALAHEYGHALDYFFGTFVEQSKFYRSLTYGSDTSLITKNIDKKGSLRYQMTEIIRAIQQTRSYRYMRKSLVTKGESDSYWLRHNELWARLFEVWVNYKMREKGITNRFLHKEKYKSLAKSIGCYQTQTEFSKIRPLVDRLILDISKQAN